MWAPQTPEAIEEANRNGLLKTDLFQSSGE